MDTHSRAHFSPVTGDRFLEQLREQISKHLRDWPVRVYLFGSRATGRTRVGSDCDIGIDSKQSLPLGVLGYLREELEESWIPYGVEVIDLSQVDQDFARQVRREGVLWIDTSKR